MAAYFIDLDGTIFYFGTNEPLPNAIENLLALQAQGHQLIFTTQRGYAGDAKKVLQKFGVKGTMLTGIESPRIVVNDQGARAINRVTDTPWAPPP